MKFPLVTAQVTMAVALAQVEFLTAAFCFKQPIVELRRVSAIGRFPKSSLGAGGQLPIKMGSPAA